MRDPNVVSMVGACPARGRGWRWLPGYFVVFTLAMLLVSSTPMGTGAGIHQFDLVHPLFDHLHLVNGRLVSHEQFDQAQALASAKQPHPSDGPAFGAGSGGAPSEPGLGISPTLPLAGVGVVSERPRSALMNEPRVPAGRSEAPPDPPPTAAA